MSLRKLGTRNEVRPSGPRLNDGFSAASASSFFAGITDGATLRLRRGRPHGKPASRPARPPVKNLASGLYRIAKEEGWHVLFKGLGPACFEKVPSTAIGYLIYEAMKRTLGLASV